MSRSVPAFSLLIIVCSFVVTSQYFPETGSKRFKREVGSDGSNEPSATTVAANVATDVGYAVVSPAGISVICNYKRPGVITPSTLEPATTTEKTTYTKFIAKITGISPPAINKNDWKKTRSEKVVSNGKDLFVSYTSVPWDFGPDAIFMVPGKNETKLVYYSSKSTIQTLAGANDMLFWVECSAANKDSTIQYLRIWDRDMDKWEAGNITLKSGTLASCRMEEEDMVVSHKKIRTPEKNEDEYTFYWTDRSDHTSHKIKTCVWKRGTGAECTDTIVTDKYRNPHALALSKDNKYLYFSTNEHMRFSIKRLDLTSENINNAVNTLYNGFNQRLTSLVVLSDNDFVWTDWVSKNVWRLETSKSELTRLPNIYEATGVTMQLSKSFCP